MDEQMHQYEDGVVAIKDDKIVAVGLESELRNQYTPTQTIDCGVITSYSIHYTKLYEWRRTIQSRNTALCPCEWRRLVIEYHSKGT